MAKKITVNLEIVTPETTDYFSATLACPADHSEAAETASSALAYVADKGRRALGFLTETQIQQQREQLESLANAMGGQSEEQSDAEPEVTHYLFRQAMENMAADLALSGVENSMRYPLHAALDMVRAEFVRVLAEAEGGPVPEDAPSLDDVLTAEEKPEGKE